MSRRACSPSWVGRRPPHRPGYSSNSAQRTTCTPIAPGLWPRSAFMQQFWLQSARHARRAVKRKPRAASPREATAATKAAKKPDWSWYQAGWNWSKRPALAECRGHARRPPSWPRRCVGPTFRDATAWSTRRRETSLWRPPLPLSRRTPGPRRLRLPRLRRLLPAHGPQD